MSDFVARQGRLKAGCSQDWLPHNLCRIAMASKTKWHWASACQRPLAGAFRNPQATRFVFFRFHPLWWRMLELALLKGLAQGYIVTAPAMLIMLLVGQEGTLGATQAIGGVFTACLMYTVGRVAAPKHRIFVFSAGLLLFFLGAVTNTLLFNAVGVLIFIACLLLAKPLLDLAYYPIQLQVIDVVSRLERRNEYTYKIGR